MFCLHDWEKWGKCYGSCSNCIKQARRCKTCGKIQIRTVEAGAYSGECARANDSVGFTDEIEQMKATNAATNQAISEGFAALNHTVDTAMKNLREAAHQAHLKEIGS